MARKNQRPPLTREQQLRKSDRALRRAGFEISRGGWDSRPRRKTSFWRKIDRVRDPKTAFRYLLDNFSGQNSGKLLNDLASRGEYYWIERDRSADQSYYIVRKRGNYVVVTQRKWVVDGQGVNTFLGGLVGYKSEPVCVDKVILRHPIMQVETFLKAYKAAAPELGVWDD